MIIEVFKMYKTYPNFNVIEHTLDYIYFYIQRYPDIRAPA